eukprot:8741100-Pyramimonas_sp.AAC.1
MVELSKMSKEESGYLDKMSRAASKMTDAVMDTLNDAGEEMRKTSTGCEKPGHGPDRVTIIRWGDSTGTAYYTECVRRGKACVRVTRLQGWR